MSGIKNNVVIPVNVMFQPSNFNENLYYTLIQLARKKNNNKLVDIAGVLHVIINIRKILVPSITNKLIRNCDDGSSRFHFDIVVTTFTPTVNDHITCKISMISSDFIEGVFENKTPIYFLVVIDSDNINHDVFDIIENEVVVRSTNYRLQKGDNIEIQVDNIKENVLDLVIFSKLINIR